MNFLQLAFENEKKFMKMNHLKFDPASLMLLPQMIRMSPFVPFGNENDALRVVLSSRKRSWEEVEAFVKFYFFFSFFYS